MLYVVFDGVRCRWFGVINSGKNFGIRICSFRYVMMGISMMVHMHDRIMFGSISTIISYLHYQKYIVEKPEFGWQIDTTYLENRFSCFEYSENLTKTLDLHVFSIQNKSIFSVLGRSIIH